MWAAARWSRTVGGQRLIKRELIRRQSQLVALLCRQVEFLGHRKHHFNEVLGVSQGFSLTGINKR
jgi:hypothetical protein